MTCGALKTGFSKIIEKASDATDQVVAWLFKSMVLSLY